MPDIPFDVGEMYAGLMPIDMNDTSRALYFVFQPTVGAPVDEITIWLNGGPGTFKYSNMPTCAYLWYRLQFSRRVFPRKWSFYLELGTICSHNQSILMGQSHKCSMVKAPLCCWFWNYDFSAYEASI